MIQSVKVYHYEAFSPVPHMGNPAGVVLDAPHLTGEQMLEVAAKVGFNETSFLVPSDQADWHIRFFTPGHEMNLCGHATMATIYSMYEKGLLGNRMELTIETKAGILPVKLEPGDSLSITMRQAAPEFEPFGGSLQELAQAMGIEESDIDTGLPTLYGSTGVWTLLIPVKGLAAFKRMKPDNKCFPEILKERPRASLHPFCLETYDPLARMHARHFSSPFSGTVEDPVTGTASGVMGAYYARYIAQNSPANLELLIEQGQEIGRDGRVRVHVIGGDIIEVTGQAVYVGEMEVVI